MDTVPQGLSRFLTGSGLIFRAQQEIRDVHRFDPLIIFIYLLADIYGYLYIAKVYGYNRNAWGYGKDQYVWNEIPDSHDIAQKIRRLKAEGLWLTVRDRYIDRKNMYLSRWWDKDHPSFIAYIETVNEIYYQYFGQK